MTDRDTRPKILIVDDTKENIDLLMEVFRNDYRIIAATNPERALKLAQGANPPDIVLLDILMPEMDGYEVCAALKRNEATKRIPVIFVTAVSEVMDSTRGFSTGAVDYITKPFHPPMVRARVRLHLDLKSKYELLESYAFIDALTEVNNRRRFDLVLDAEWNRARRSGRPLSLIYIDVDHFKQFNDTYGHGGGDDCLRQIATALSGALQRSGDFIARYGGEEFMVLLPYTNHSEAMEIAQRLSDVVDALKIPHASTTVAEHVTLSMGVISAEPDARRQTRDIIEAADRALYAAKHGGRHCIVYGDL